MYVPNIVAPKCIENINGPKKIKMMQYNKSRALQYLTFSYGNIIQATNQ